MIIPLFALPDEVIVEKFIGNSAYGPKYDKPMTVRCRVERKRRLIQKPDGTQIVSMHSLIAQPNGDITPGSRVTVDGVKTTVLDAMDRKVLVNPHHTEVVLI